MDTIATSLGALKSTIRNAGLRSTAPRVAVLRQLIDNEQPISHGELVEKLQSLGIDRATVFRNLVDLTQAGLVRRTDLGDHVWRFELSKEEGKGMKHPHFTCTDCGTVECLPEVIVKARDSQKIPKALLQQRVEVQLRGKCDSCQ
jgi:Fur family transcriptional regulator, ferric uptake regulator